VDDSLLTVMFDYEAVAVVKNNGNETLKKDRVCFSKSVIWQKQRYLDCFHSIF
jgi:hypothetical protein